MSLSVLEERKRVVTDWIQDVFNKKDLSAVDKLKTSAYLDWTPFPAQRHDLPVSGLKESLPDFFGSFPDFHFTADHMIAEDEFVVALGNWHGTHSAEFMGIPPTGKRITGTRIDIFRVVNEKMIEHWGCGAELSFLKFLNREPVNDDGHADTDDDTETARAFLERIVNQRDLTAVPEMIAADGVERAGGAVLLSRVLTAFPDYHLDIEGARVVDGVVEITSRYTGSHHGNFGDQPPTGRGIEGTRIDRFSVEDGTIKESWMDWDIDHVREQIAH